MATPDQDRRKGKPRIVRRLPVRFGTDAKMCGGTATDISEGGLKIECTESFSTNSVIIVFVQFPRHSVRLRARVIWCGAASSGGAGTMGLALTQPEPSLKRAVAEWLAEVKLAAAEDQVSGAVSAAASAATAAATRPQMAAPPAEPAGPVVRCAARAGGGRLEPDHRAAPPPARRRQAGLPGDLPRLRRGREDAARVRPDALTARAAPVPDTL